MTSAFDRFSNIGAVRSVRLGRSDIRMNGRSRRKTFDIGYATGEPCLCALFAVTGEVTGN